MRRTEISSSSFRPYVHLPVRLTIYVHGTACYYPLKKIFPLFVSSPTAHNGMEYCLEIPTEPFRLPDERVRLPDESKESKGSEGKIRPYHE